MDSRRSTAWPGVSEELLLGMLDMSPRGPGKSKGGASQVNLGETSRNRDTLARRLIGRDRGKQHENALRRGFGDGRRIGIGGGRGSGAPCPDHATGLLHQRGRYDESG